ncbi:hypothetical protein GUJ93_ZPchr0003g16795 [Zizania palustris]|uniref:Uncharacterized protein n=1 Tax=Zizania palustris TaxID=103762 RepID=A0A8J5RWE6_ZIZPA|nr:hypothetical protein GUJ93_ZPchr0003g16795 [Zizania palustris]
MTTPVWCCPAKGGEPTGLEDWMTYVILAADQQRTATSMTTGTTPAQEEEVAGASRRMMAGAGEVVADWMMAGIAV